MLDKSFGLFDKKVVWMYVASAFSTWFSIVDEVKRVKVDARECLGDIYCKIAWISSEAIEPVEENNDRLGVLGWLRDVVVDSVALIFEMVLIGVGHRQEGGLAWQLRGLHHLFQEIISLMMRDRFKEFFIFFVGMVTHCKK